MAKFITKSIQKNLLVSFFLVGVVSTSFILLTIFHFIPIKRATNDLLKIYNASSFYLLNLKDGVNQLNVQTSVSKDNSDDIAKRDFIWKNNISPFLDSLQKVSENWNNNQDVEQYNALKSSLLQVQQLSSKIAEKVDIKMNFGNSNPPSEDVTDDSTEVLTQLLTVSEETVADDNLELTNDDANNKNIEQLDSAISLVNAQLSSLIMSIKNEAKINEAIITRKVKLFNLLSPFAAIINIVGFILAFILLKNRFVKSVNQIKDKVSILKSGNLPEKTINCQNELDIICKDLDVITENLHNVKDFAQQVGNGKFDNNINIFNNEGDIGSSLAEMRESLRKVESEDKKRNWANNGFTLFADVLRQHSGSLEDLSFNVISQLVKYLKVNQGGLFICNELNDSTSIDLVACYAFDRKKYIKKSLLPGEGLVGQCYFEKASIYLIDVPQDYIDITSGLGGARPACVFIFPLLSNDQIHGVIELASFQHLEKHEIDFLEQIGESIASSISMVKINQSTRKMLDDAHIMAEQMRAQEEEMRQNMEELQATQEEMHRFTAEMNGRINALNEAVPILEIETDGKISSVNQKFLDLLKYQKHQLVGSSHSLILPHDERNGDNFNKFWQTILSGDAVDGMYNRIDGNNEVVVLIGTYYSLKDKDGNPFRIIFQAYRASMDIENSKNLSATSLNIETGLAQTQNEKIKQLNQYQMQLQESLLEKLKRNEEKFKRL